MKKAIDWLFKQPDNPNMPRPIFVIGLLIALAFTIFRFYGGDIMGGNKVDLPTANEGTFISNVVGKVKDRFDGIFNKESKFVEVNLPPLPSVSEHSHKLDEELLKSVDNIGKDNYEMAEIELESIGRKDPMRPLKTPNLEIFRYEAYEDDIFFYPIGTLKENEEKVTVENANEKDETKNKENEENEEPNNEPQEPIKKEIVKYRTWEEASVEKIPSKEAIEYRDNKDSSRNNIAYIKDDLINDSINYFQGMTLDQVVLDSVCLNDKLFPTATFLSLGGEYTGMQVGDYLNDIYYIVDVDYLKQEVTLEYVSDNTIKRHTLNTFHLKNKNCGFK